MLGLALVLATSSLVSAAPEAQARPARAPTAASLVEEQLIRPLEAKEVGRSKFSRARQPATARRVRMIDLAPQRDASGRTFVRFVVDERFGFFGGDDEEDSWSKDAITGCAYVDSREVFVKRGNAFHPAESRLGKKTKAAAGSVCNAAAKVVAR